MSSRFHVSALCVKMVDIDPQYRGVANQENFEVEVYGHLVHGEVLAGMLVNFRPQLKRDKYYRIHSINTVERAGDMLADIEATGSKPPPEAEKLLTKTAYILNLICKERREFEELVDMKIQNENAELLSELK